MAGQRQPTDLVVMNGRKHLTKAEIEARKNAEVTAPCDKVRPPSYLTPEQKKQFRKIAKELLEIKLISNLDCDALARLLIAQTQYIEITEQIRATPLMEDVPVYEMEYLRNGVNGTIIKPNEARRKLDMEDAEGGDVLLANGSIVPLTMAGAAYLKGESEQENTDEPEQPEKETEPDTEQPDTATEPDETDTAEDETDEEGGE